MVTIEISGKNKSGKSIIAQEIRHSLESLGIKILVKPKAKR